ncbi:hypothetical protein B0A55_05479 [Friedmanniomyces simplex]|uniref:Uncharacterized protein n=1 Tax=Friedmanniomyces simplex TaxID=329884 RepID=A0A4U0XDV5_9PEZI|nr:hypothetical protein B0A55_05479 [Friedmanniomyces simplex]
MDTQPWTAEAIRDARVAEILHPLMGIDMGLLPVLFIIWALIRRYSRSLNKIYMFLIPSACLLSILTGIAIIKVFLYTGITFSILGLRIGFSRPIPSTCEAASKIVGHHALPCHIERLREWISLVMSGGSWNQILTRSAVVNASIVIGLLLLCVVIGVVICRGTVWWLWCVGCQQERKQDDWDEADYGIKGARCRRCRDIELGASITKSVGILLVPDATMV